MATDIVTLNAMTTIM